MKMRCGLLFMPVVDLMNVSEYDLILPRHVLRNTFFPNPFHKALRIRRKTDIWKLYFIIKFL